ncbi:MAG: tRNA pseudouridine(55) synthase TruB [Sphingomonadales bacterium]|nr:tRNA pseudouridine(55) synthase TruB [Sphingomonadales bacterium]MBU3993652.1 tRNA pseudouridine(55) synthase TruB [Alphaproteobacteria bacterium]
MQRKAPNGWIILDKPVDLGSTQAVAAVKRNLREAGYGKGVKVGHGGTLDPLATGVLPIALGEATKLCGRMLDASKAYAFTVQFGSETDTLDLEGAIVAHSEVRPSRAGLEAVLPRFTGPIEQVPPVYSALMVDGRRAYDLARAGEEVTLKSRAVTIHALRLIEAEGAADALEAATFEVHVSKGTYIRSLARDIALALGTRGHVTMLRRVKAGPFGLSEAISLDKLNEVGKGAPLENVLLPLEAGLVDIPALDLDPDQARAVRQGRVLTGLPQTQGLYWARAGIVPVALVELSGGSLSVVRGFNLSDVAE